MKQRRTIIIITVAVLLLVVACVGLHQCRYWTRRAWKNNAIAQVSKHASDPAWVAAQIEMIRARHSPSQGEHRYFSSPDMILMKNGEWIACASICRKQDWRIDDIFIGRGSDGKWYYSTYHFCIDMMNLTMYHERPSLQDFAQIYFLREFDGQSNDCLQATWPPSR